MGMPLAVTMGEPTGIGAEILLKAWSVRTDRALPSFFVVDYPERLEAEARRYNIPVSIKTIETPQQAADLFPSALPVLPLPSGLSNAQAVLESIKLATNYALNKTASGIVTSPIHKGLLQDSGLFDYPGHTEYLAHLTGGKETPVMMLTAADLRVVPLTIHIALKDVPSAITEDLLLEKARIVHHALQLDFGLKAPRLALAGLNPHAGEGGKFGTEEDTILRPALKKLQAEGINITGPHSADTLFHAAARQHYDCALCLYHDQALIPVKTIDFYGGVNVTLGLPIVRTSPDHGTALDIAGKGLASPDSLIAALSMAAAIAKSRAAARFS